MSAAGGVTGVQDPGPGGGADGENENENVGEGAGRGAAGADPWAEVTAGERARPAPRRRGRRRYAAAAGVLAIVIGGGTAAYALTTSGDEGTQGGGGEGGRSGKGGAASVASAAITRGDIVDTESVEGDLTYADERTISGMTSGVVTAIPAEGATITRGRPLLRVNDRPVILMYGALPLFRSLREGIDDGRDVRQLERNLKALGYGDDLTVDTEFTALTAEAVRAWQDDVGLPETGAVDTSQVVFQPAAVRIADVKTSVGGRIGPGPALTVTGTRPIVHVDLDAGKQDLAVKGAKVNVELPDGRRVAGKITKVGTVAESSGSGDGAEGETAPTVDVEIRLSGDRRGRLDQAPVSVDLEHRRSRDVLSVPVEALLGLREGGFGVEVVEVVEAGGTGRIVPVEIGAFGGGRVEVTGEGLRAGLRVGVPAS